MPFTIVFIIYGITVNLLLKQTKSVSTGYKKADIKRLREDKQVSLPLFYIARAKSGLDRLITIVDLINIVWRINKY